MRAIEFKKSFDRSYRCLSPSDQSKVDETIEAFLTILEENRLPSGLGLKKLVDDLWEIRVGLGLRIAFRMKKDRVEFGLVGNHDDIKRYIKLF
jgi:mRNA-degrading endonuclease RelE of RelBE toxin-antitoxin system